MGMQGIKVGTREIRVGTQRIKVRMRAIRVGMRRMGVGMLEMQRMWGIRVRKPLSSCFHRVAIASFLSTFNNVSKAFHLPNFE